MLESKNFENEEMFNNYKDILANLVSRLGECEVKVYVGEKWNWTTLTNNEHVKITIGSQYSRNGKNDVNFKIDVTQYNEEGHGIWSCDRVKIPYDASKRVLENRLAKVLLP